MAIPLTGPISVNDIRKELGMPAFQGFSFQKAFLRSQPDYPPVLNPYSPVIPSNTSPYNIEKWRGYNSCSLVCRQGDSLFSSGVAVSRLRVFVNNVLVLDVTASNVTNIINVNPGDTFYAIQNPITLSTFFGTTFQILRIGKEPSPFNSNVNVIQNQTNSFGGFPQFTSNPVIVNLEPINLGVYEILSLC